MSKTIRNLKISRNPLLIIFLGIAALILANSYLKSQSDSVIKNVSERHSHENLGLSPQEIKSLRVEVENKVKNNGIRKTSEELAKYHIDNGPTIISHALTHYLGEIAYDQFGLEGIKICSKDAPAGCYHGVMMRALEKEGFSDGLITKVTSICKGPEIVEENCIHFFGHVFVSGYGIDQIQKSMNSCKNLVGSNLDPDPCYSGVFMEYYFPGLYTEITRDPVKKINENNPYDICLSLNSDEFRKQCMIYTVEWWHFGQHYDFQKITNLCNQMANSKAKDACFFGIGTNSADSLDFYLDGIKEACSYSKSDSQITLCLSGGVHAILENSVIDKDKTINTLCPDKINSCEILSESFLN